MTADMPQDPWTWRICSRDRVKSVVQLLLLSLNLRPALPFSSPDSHHCLPAPSALPTLNSFFQSLSLYLHTASLRYCFLMFFFHSGILCLLACCVEHEDYSYSYIFPLPLSFQFTVKSVFTASERLSAAVLHSVLEVHFPSCTHFFFPLELMASFLLSL